MPGVRNGLFVHPLLWFFALPLSMAAACNPSSSTPSMTECDAACDGGSDSWAGLDASDDSSQGSAGDTGSDAQAQGDAPSESAIPESGSDASDSDAARDVGAEAAPDAAATDAASDGAASIAATCNNHVQDFSIGETDVDCGGSCVGVGNLCVAGQGCLDQSDCVTGMCNSSYRCALRPNGFQCFNSPLNCTSHYCDGTYTCAACTGPSDCGGSACTSGMCP